MPLLPAEPFVFPENLLTEPSDGGPDAGRWWVLHTRPRAEKALVRRVLPQEVPFFLPLYKRQWRSRGRLFSSYVPLFPGYVFLRGEDQERIKALETKMVVNCLPVPDQGRLRTDLVRVYQ